MADRRFDPDRRCAPASEWPAADRVAWDRAFHKGSILDGSGPGARWRPKTRSAREKAYGRFITFLERGGLLGVQDPVERINAEVIDAYIRHLQSQSVASSSVWSYLDHLCAAVQAMFPKADWHWLRMAVNRLRAMAKPARPIAPRLIPLPRRVKAGFKLMQEAESNDKLRPLLRAGRFRDGLMLVLQSLVALRLYNLTNIRIGEELVETSDGFWLRFGKPDMKGRRPFEIPVPIDLNPYVARYLSFWRPVLLQECATESLWLSQAGRAMRTNTVHRRVTMVTRRLLGKAMPTHLFRHGLASHIADVDPDHVRMAMPLLHHRQFRTTDGYIVRAGSLKASRSQNAHLRELRKELEQSCRLRDIIENGDQVKRGNGKRRKTKP